MHLLPLTTSRAARPVCLLLSWGFMLSLSTAFAAEPYRPTNDSVVLERLPRVLLAGCDELGSLRRQLLADPANADLAVEVATRYMQMGNLEGDPRFYGYARAAIQPWWEAPSAAPTVLQLRAKLKEKNHQYDQAIDDLNTLLEVQPRNAQAWIEIANIYRVQGKYRKAQEASDQLSLFASEAQVLLCRVPIQAVTGEAQQAYGTLERVVPKAKQLWPSAVPWMRVMQAKIAWSLGYEQPAEEHFHAGLANSPDNTYQLRTYADFLLDRGRNEEVLSLLREHVSDNGILLRAAIAARLCGKVTLAARWKSQLESRFEEIYLRGNQPHGRFEARYELELNDNPKRALEVALKNWQKQKEVRDTRNVLEAAVAAHDPASANPVLDFLDESGTEDVKLHELIQKLEQ